MGDMYAYNTISNSWVASFGAPSARYYATAVSGTDRAWMGLGTGTNQVGEYKDWYQFNPATLVFTKKADFPGGPISGISGVAFGNQAFVGNLFPDWWWSYQDNNKIPVQTAAGGLARQGVVRDPAWTNNNGTIYLTGNGQVGIDTSNPTAKLDVRDTIRTKQLQITNGAQAGYAFVSNAGKTGNWGLLTNYETDPVKQPMGKDTLPIVNQNLVYVKSAVKSTADGRVGLGGSPVSERLLMRTTRGMQASSINTGNDNANWIAGDFGGSAGNRVVMGVLFTKPTIGATTFNNVGPAPLRLNPIGPVVFGPAGTAIRGIVTGNVTTTALTVPARQFTAEKLALPNSETSAVVQVTVRGNTPLPAGIILCNSRISANGTVEVGFGNVTAADINIPAGISLTVMAINK
jgi:hypothetical protein